MTIKKTIKKLESLYLETPEKIFTMYLNTDPADPDQQGGEWRIHLKNGLNRFEKYLDTDGNESELKNFQKVKKAVKGFFKENELDLKKSVVIIATPDEFVYSDILQIPVDTEFFWEEIAKVDQLVRLHQEYPKAGVILTQKEAIRLVETELGKLVDTVVYELDLDTEDWRKHSAVSRNHSSASATSGKSINLREQFIARFEENRKRWYKSITPMLDKLAKDREWEYIYLVGPHEETHEIKDLMNKPINACIDKNMLDDHHDKVIKAIHDL